MRTLVIETAGAACSVALFEADMLLAERHEEVGRGHAERLIPMIAELPDGGRADAILVDRGPGSFTGVRVGIAAARALGLGWGASVHAYSSLALLAMQADRDRVDTLAVAIHGGHGQLFAQRFNGEPLRPMSDLASLTLANAAAMLPDSLVVGDAATELVGARGFGDARAASLRACDALRLPADLRRQPPSPLYGRAPDAQPTAPA